MRIPFPVRVIPSLTFRAWLTPPPLGRSISARDREEVADLSRCHFGGVPGFEAGEGDLVLAIHGWGGRGAQMAPMARHLAANGFRVVAPTLPGSAGGEVTDVLKAADALRAVIDDLGQPVAVVGHSFASMVLRVAFSRSGSAPSRMVLIAPALDVHDALDVFSDRLRLLPWARRGLYRRLQAWNPALWPLLSSSPADQFEGAEMLIVHDPDDPDTPFLRSAELTARRPGTTLVPVTGGHSRILSQPEVLTTITTFISGDPVASRSAA